MKRMILLALLVGVASLLGAARLEAFIDPPQIVPGQPDELSDINVHIRAGICDTFATLGPLDRELEVEGNNVQLRVRGHSTTDFAQCNFIPGTFIYQIGRLPPGQYELEVYQRAFFVPTQLTLVGTAQFTVGVSTVVPIPVLGAGSMWLLTLLLAGTAGLALRWHGR